MAPIENTAGPRTTSVDTTGVARPAWRPGPAAMWLVLGLAACETLGLESEETAGSLPPVAEQQIGSLSAAATNHPVPAESGKAQISSDTPHVVVIRNSDGRLVGTWLAGVGKREPVMIACFEALQRLRGSGKRIESLPPVCKSVPVREITTG